MPWGGTEEEIETLLNVLRAIEGEDFKRIKDKLKKHVYIVIKALSDGCLFYCDVAKVERRHMSENNFEREVLDRLKTIEVKMDSYSEVKNQVYQNQRDILTLQDLKDDVSELKDRNKWLVRTLGASLIGVVVTVVCFAIKLGAM